jgi:hypothetical protein
VVLRTEAEEYHRIMKGQLLLKSGLPGHRRIDEAGVGCIPQHPTGHPDIHVLTEHLGILGDEIVLIAVGLIEALYEVCMRPWWWCSRFTAAVGRFQGFKCSEELVGVSHLVHVVAQYGEVVKNNLTKHDLGYCRDIIEIGDQ